MSASLLFQQCPACRVRLIRMVFEMVVGGRTAAVLWDAASRICLIYLVASSSNCRQAFNFF